MRCSTNARPFGALNDLPMASRNVPATSVISFSLVPGSGASTTIRRSPPPPVSQAKCMRCGISALSLYVSVNIPHSTSETYCAYSSRAAFPPFFRHPSQLVFVGAICILICGRSLMVFRLAAKKKRKNSFSCTDRRTLCFEGNVTMPVWTLRINRRVLGVFLESSKFEFDDLG